MAISVVGQASAAATSVAIPTHAVGDLILVFARGTAAAPSVPAASGTVPAWATVQSGVANSIGLTCVSFVATATTTTTGAFTNATHICVLVLRPGAAKFLQTSAALSSAGNGNNTQTIIYPALTLALTDGTSMGVRVGTRTVAITAVGTAPTNWTNQSIQPAGASALMSVHTRAALVANPTADTVTVTSSNAAYRAVTIEVQELNLAQSVSVSGLVSPQAFGTFTTVKGRVTVQVPSVYPPGSVIQTSITGQVTSGDGHLVGGGLNTSAQFGVPTALNTFPPQTVVVTGKGTSQTFGALAFRVTLGAGGVLSAQAFGVPTIKAVVTRTVTGLGSAQSFGTVTPKATITRTVTGLDSAQSFGAPTVTTTIPSGSVSVSGVASAQSFGAPTLAKGAVSRAVTGIGSAQSFGVVTPKAAITRTVTGVGSAQAFGTPVATNVASGQTKAVGGVGSAQAFGTLTARPSQTVQVPGLQQRAGLGLSITGQVTCGDGHLVLGGGGGLFGQVVIRTAVGTGTVNGVSSAQAFGSPHIAFRQFSGTVPGVPSAQAFGVPHIAFAQKIVVGGVASAGQLGAPAVYIVWMRDSTCTDLDLAESDAVDLELAELLCEHDMGTAVVCDVGPPFCGLTVVDESEFSSPLSQTDLDLSGAVKTTVDLQPLECE